MKLISIHPFPARMAPEIVFRQLERLPSRSTILDPMSGSGTVLRAASELGHQAIGFDLDPLAVLMSRVWTTALEERSLRTKAEAIVDEAKSIRGEYLPWIDDCGETTKYVNFWFCRKQIRALRRLSFVLSACRGGVSDVMRLALSRTIITKERGASIARDASHSRPHRVFFNNEYDVYDGFLQATSNLAARLMSIRLSGAVSVRRGDARGVIKLRARSVDAVITSPPYLNAIDYLRGHRLSLVWLGFGVAEIRKLRSNSIGAEAIADDRIPASVVDRLMRTAGRVSDLPSREAGMVRRYAQDIYVFLREIARVTKRGGDVLLVVGNSCLQNIPIWNADINLAAAAMLGFEAVERSERVLPVSHRYLPLPEDNRSGPLGRRMRTETLLNLKAS
jgi:DNA modification methylase